MLEPIQFIRSTTTEAPSNFLHIPARISPENGGLTTPTTDGLSVQTFYESLVFQNDVKPTQTADHSQASQLINQATAASVNHSSRPFINQSTVSSVNPSTQQLINQSTVSSVNPSTQQLINQANVTLVQHSIQQSADQASTSSVKRSTRQSINQPPTSPSHLAIPKTPRRTNIPSDSRHHALLKKLTVSDLLQSAAENNVPRLAQYIALGFDLNSADMFGWTALMCASQRGSFDAVRCLITSGGVDFTRRNTKNQSAADLAAISRQSAIASYLCELENYELFDVKLPLKEVEKDEEVVTQPFFCSVCGVTFERTTEEEHRTSILHQLHTGFAPGKTASYGLPESNVGFRLMRQSGWDSEKGLGAAENGRRYPIATVFKRDRLGLGRAGKESPRVTHYPHQLEREGKVKPADGAATKRDITARLARSRRKEIEWGRTFNGL